MKLSKCVLVLALLAVVSAPASAQIGNPYGLQDDHNVQFVRSNWGTYWGPYTLNVFDPSGFANAGYAPGMNLIDAFCVDFNHHVWSGVTWEATFTPLSDLEGLLVNTLYGRTAGLSPTELQLGYQRSAWLASQFALNSRDEGLYIHNALWHLWTDQPNGAPENGWGELALQQNFVPDDYSDWYVVSDTRMERQEFLVRASVVPEPSTIILMGMGLVAVMGLTFVMRQSVG